MPPLDRIRRSLLSPASFRSQSATLVGGVPQLPQMAVHVQKKQESQRRVARELINARVTASLVSGLKSGMTKKRGGQDRDDGSPRDGGTSSDETEKPAKVPRRSTGKVPPGRPHRK